VTVAEYNKCVDLHSDALFRFIVKNIRDQDDARDVVQDAFEKVWLKAAEVPFEKGKSYLFTTAYRIMLERIRKKSRTSPLDNTLRIVPAEESKPEFDLRKVLDEAIAKLPDDQRSVVMLRDYEGYSYKEIGDIVKAKDSFLKYAESSEATGLLSGAADGYT
jgi:RNA polymerase sigma-70 factor (ECF subfamily)